MSLPTIHKNMKLADALTVAESLGFQARQGKGGEVVIVLPGRCMRINSRRSDAPQPLVAIIRRLYNGITPCAR